MAGVAVGAILGILFAPDKGSATREKISKKGSDLGGDLSGKVKEFTDMISKQFDSMREETAQMAGKGKEQVSDMADKFGSVEPK